MKRKYWIPAAVLFAAGAVIYCTSFSNAFSGIIFCIIAAFIAVFGGIDSAKKRYPRAMKYAQRVLLIFLSLCAAAVTATGIWIGVCATGSANPEADYVIVLGAGVNGTVPSRSLCERLNAALEYLTAYPDAICVLSGGQGSGEDITEAQCMYDWLVEKGIDADRLRLEPEAVDTQGNISFSLAVIEEETGSLPETVAVISSEYHLCRAEIYARAAGVEALGYPARTSDVLNRANYFMREIFGVWVSLLIS